MICLVDAHAEIKTADSVCLLHSLAQLWRVGCGRRKKLSKRNRETTLNAQSWIVEQRAQGELPFSHLHLHSRALIC